MSGTNGNFNPSRDFWRDTTAIKSTPDGVNDTTEAISHYGTIHVGAPQSGAPNTNGFLHEAIVSYVGNGSYQNQTISTNIPLDSLIMPSVRVKGYCYGTSDTVDLTIAFYTYNAPSGAIINPVCTNNGSVVPANVRLGYLGGLIQIELDWPVAEYFMRYEVSAYCDGNATNFTDNWFQGWTIANNTFPATVTNIVSARMKGPVSPNFHLQDKLILNGTLKVSLKGEVSWTNRLITMTSGQGNHETVGYHDLFMPPVGTVIPVSDGTTVTVTAATAGQTGQSGGIQLNAWQSLWYRAPKVTANGVNYANYRIQRYQDNDGSSGFPNPNGILAQSNDAEEWLLICTREDQNHFFFPFAQSVLSLGGQIGGSEGLTITSVKNLKKCGILTGYAFTTFANTSMINNWFGYSGVLRFMGGGRNAYAVNTGYFDIPQSQKTAGTPIIGWGNPASRTWVAPTLAAHKLNQFGGLTNTAVNGNAINPTATTVMQFLNYYETLYYAPNLDSPTAGGTWYIADFNSPTIPEHWIPIATTDNGYGNNAVTLLFGELNLNLRPGEAKWCGNVDGEMSMMHERMGVQHDGLKYCRGTTAAFFAGAGANGNTSGPYGVMVSWDDYTLISGICDSNYMVGNTYSWINVPPAGTAIPVLDFVTGGGGSNISRVVQTIGAHRYVPLSQWEALWYIPPRAIGGYNAVAGDFVITYYSFPAAVPRGAILIAKCFASPTGLNGTSKMRVKFADGTYMQPGCNWAAAGSPAENDNAQGTGDWRDITTANGTSTPPGGNAVLPAVPGIVGPLAAPYAPQFRYLEQDSDPRGLIQLKGLIQLNSLLPNSTQNIAFMPGVYVVGIHIVMAMLNCNPYSDNKPIPVELRFTNGSLGNQAGVYVSVYAGSASAANPIVALGGATGANWLSLDNITLPSG